jgi:hypothetical protein
MEVFGWKSVCSALLSLCLTVASNCSVIAGDTHYTCIIISASRLTDEGTLASHSSLKSTIGEKFTVDRETGRIIGGPLDNSHLKIQLIDKGSREMSFQSFALSTQRSHTIHIQIQEFQPAESKPFVGTTTLYYPGVYSGTCQ